MKRAVLSIVGLGVVVVGSAMLVSYLNNSQPFTTFIRDVEQELPTIELAPQTVTFNDGTEVTYKIAKPFEIAVAAEDLGKARFMTMSPDGRLFVPDMVDYNLSREGKIFI